MSIRTVETDFSARLRHIAADPMWANHCEVNKSTLARAAGIIDDLASLLRSYVEDDDSMVDDFDGIQTFPDQDEARKIQAIATLKAYGVEL